MKPEDLAAIEVTALTLNEGTNVSPADVAELYMRLRVAQKRLADLRSTVEAAIIEWIEDNGPVDMGEAELVTRLDKKERIRDPDEALLEALTRLEYDADQIAKVLSRNALKPGACEAIIGKDFREKHFAVETTKRLDDSKVKKKLAVIEKRYLK